METLAFLGVLAALAFFKRARDPRSNGELLRDLIERKDLSAGQEYARRRGAVRMKLPPSLELILTRAELAEKTGLPVDVSASEVGAAAADLAPATGGASLAVSVGAFVGDLALGAFDAFLEDLSAKNAAELRALEASCFGKPPGTLSLIPTRFERVERVVFVDSINPLPRQESRTVNGRTVRVEIPPFKDAIVAPSKVAAGGEILAVTTLGAPTCAMTRIPDDDRAELVALIGRERALDLGLASVGFFDPEGPLGAEARARAEELTAEAFEASPIRVVFVPHPDGAVFGKGGRGFNLVPDLTEQQARDLRVELEANRGGLERFGLPVPDALLQAQIVLGTIFTLRETPGAVFFRGEKTPGASTSTAVVGRGRGLFFRGEKTPGASTSSAVVGRGRGL